MSTVGQIERETQNRIVQLFQKQLEYRYIGNLEEEENNSNLRETDFLKFLDGQGYSKILITKAVSDFKKAIAINTTDDLYQANKAVYSLIE